jgi:hypothetical protein
MGVQMNHEQPPLSIGEWGMKFDFFYILIFLEFKRSQNY